MGISKGREPLANLHNKQNVSFCFLGSPTYADKKIVRVSAFIPTASDFPHNVWSEELVVVGLQSVSNGL